MSANPKLFVVESFVKRYDDGDPLAVPVGMLEASTEITLRDLFAAAALAGLCSNPGLLDTGLTPAEYRDSFAASAFKAADAMLKARESTGGKP